MFKISKSVDSTNNNPSVLFNYYPTIIENIQVSSDEKNDTFSTVQERTSRTSITWTINAVVVLPVQTYIRVWKKYIWVDHDSEIV
jgi:hypothetical protein